MVKLTKRKGFNFFRSYFDVYNELNDKDKVAFMDALLDRQFLGIKPTNLKGMSSFAYISQTNSIDSQVRGYEDKTKTKLLHTPTVGGKQGGKDTPTLQVEEKEKEQDVYNKKSFLINWNEMRTSYLNTPSNINRLTQEEGDLFSVANFKKEDWHLGLKGLFKQEQMPQPIMVFKPKHFLKNIDQYIDAEKNKKYNLYAN